ncbi:MAG TPA: DUF397 domain-containing protein [Glycomyces sp.]|nr:DUF397 domain-containing protein [Glycomyces sp.]
MERFEDARQDVNKAALDSKGSVALIRTVFTGAGRELSAQELAGIAWKISSRSSDNGGSCVEAGPLADDFGRVAVRHSHHPDGSVIVYTRAEWAAFLAGAKDGEFDFAG